MPQELWRELLLVLDGVAKKHSVSVSNVALKWVMQQGGGELVFPIVGMRSGEHVADNVRVFGFELDAQDLAAIDEVLKKSTGPKGDCYSFERGA
jgi:aryl-alcohol dehydrogenase-like predicted oxidoreductase